MDLFDIIQENFFSILSSKNKRLYVASLIATFKIYEMGSILGINKRDVADELTNFLEKSSYQFDSLDEDENELDEDITEAKDSKRSLAYYILRKFEECGWIYVDVNNDYEEILNFTDAGITITEALMQINPIYSIRDAIPQDDYFDEDNYIQAYNKNEYTGYIYTIYCLLTNPLNSNYAMIVQEVYRNTKQLIRALRKLDSRMKDYITAVVETTEIKDLISKLMDYKTELVDNGYARLKTGDNINKYRLPIVSKLESFEQNDNIMYMIQEEYKGRYFNPEDAAKRAYRDIDEMIDVFNSLDSYITEIDYKNKKYIDSTIGKIKFLLSEDDNITGKINSILKYIKIQNKHNHLDGAIQTCQSMFTLKQIKTYNQNTSLYSPRGRYSRTLNQGLDLSDFDFDFTSNDFVKEYSLPYDKETIIKFTSKYAIEGEIRASEIIDYNSDLDTVMGLIYTLLYACEESWPVEKLENIVTHYKFKFNDFIIKVGE